MIDSSVEVEKETAVSFWQAHGTKVGALLFWLLLLGSYFSYTTINNLTVKESISQVATLLTGSAFGPALYVFIYAIRPLIFFPATLMTILAGFLFGPIGILYSTLGGNASAIVAYTVGRYFGKGVLEEENEGIIQKYTQRMRQNSFETILLMRFIFLPFDLVNYAAGFLKINWKPFLLATFIGSIPGTISVVLFGASFGTLDELFNGELQTNPVTLAISVLLIIASIIFSRYLKAREVRKNRVL